MNRFKLQTWGIDTWVSATATILLLIVFLCYLFYCHGHYEEAPLITLGTLLLASLLYTLCSISEDIPDKQMTKLTWFVVLAIIAIPWCIFDAYERKPDGATLKFIIAYCTVIASTFSIIFVCYTLKLQRKQLRDSNDLMEQMRDKEILKIIDTFLSPEMLVHKELCTRLKEKLHTEPQAVKEMLRYAFERGIYDDCHLDPLWKKFKASEGYAEYAAFIRVARFFDLISQSPHSITTARSVHYYYTWWRRFLLDVTAIYDYAWDHTIPSRRLVSFKANWTGACRRLDEIMKRYDLPVE